MSSKPLKPLCVVQVDVMDTQAVRAVLTPLLGEGKRIPQLYPPANRVNVILYPLDEPRDIDPLLKAITAAGISRFSVNIYMTSV